ncbi:MAG: diaminopimelate epimerase [Nitrospirota bacterium]|nr:diaminopimelate epimerase [Nitrospirota bacterium]
MGIPFYKMSGSGNTFVVIDNRKQIVEESLKKAGLSLDAFIIRACSPVHGIGADGLILVENSAQHDFAWRFFNSNGSTANMCGNGARCAARFARLCGVTGDAAEFETGAGVIHSEVHEGKVRVTLTPPGAVTPDIELSLGGKEFIGYFINTGVPHLVIPVPRVGDLDVRGLGAEARFDKRFAPDGTNVNFATQMPGGELRVRTYERGVEDETMACGTGVTATALVFAHLGKVRSPVTVAPTSGEVLTVHFTREGDAFRAVVIDGPARVLFRGEIDPEALT